MVSLMEGFPVVIEVKVAWGEMDAMGHVNNIIYFRYFESVRMALFERVGWIEEMKRTGVGPILARSQAAFRKPLQYPDTIQVGARVVELGTDRFTMEYRIVSEAYGEIAAEGDGRVICFDYRANAKAPIPAVVREAIEKL